MAECHRRLSIKAMSAAMATTSRADVVKIVASGPPLDRATRRLGGLRRRPRCRRCSSGHGICAADRRTVQVGATIIPAVDVASVGEHRVGVGWGRLHLHGGLDQEPVIAGLPSSAYDSRTAEGMRAAPYLVACVPELKAFFAERPTARSRTAWGGAIFTVEGQLMDVTLVSPLMAEIEQFARRPSCGRSD